jgi:FKBP-type peptidyl-prolyl cis-trans isomerase SlpA
LLGEVVEFPAPDNAGKYAGAVAQLGDDAILFDFNHPLAGQAVSMEVHVIGVL